MNKDKIDYEGIYRKVFEGHKNNPQILQDILEIIDGDCNKNAIRKILEIQSFIQETFEERAKLNGKYIAILDDRLSIAELK